ncbi:MAG: hypothetical protein AB8B68_02170 [Rickettsiaceae bacterium]
MREQTRKIQVENKAYLAVMKEDKFYSYNSKTIKTKFQQHYEQINQETPPPKKEKSFFAKVFLGIKDSLNPYSKYNPDNKKLNAREHTGLTMAVRKKKESINSPEPKPKLVPRTMDDMSVSYKKQEGIVVNAAQKQADIERFKSDLETINKRMHKSKKRSSTETSNVVNKNPKGRRMSI